MTGGYVPGTNKNTHHRFIQGFVPHYASLATQSADANFHKKISPPYSLVLAPSVTSIRSKSSKYPTVMISNEHNALGNVIYFTNLWECFIDDASETDLGIPNGTPTSNGGIDAVVFNGKILTSHPSESRLYHGAIDATPAWTASTGNALTTGNQHVLKLLEDRCLVTNASSGAFSRSDEVKIVLPDFSIIDGIVLGDTFDIRDIASYQDRYALLFTRKTTSPRLSPHTTVFLWNAVAGDSYDEKYSLEGSYRCSIEKNGAVFAFAQLGTTLVCHMFTGGGFREIGRIRNIVVSSELNIPKTRIAIEDDFFVILATCPGSTSAAAPFYWNPFTGESFFLLRALDSLPFKSILIARDPSTAVAKRYISRDFSSTGFLYSISLESETTLEADYKSNFIPAPVVEDIHHGTGRMQIANIEIEFNAKPPGASDKLDITLTTKDDRESETYTQQTATVKSTTGASTNAKVDDKRAIIELGANATEFAIDIAATVVTSSWGCVIRRIIVNYQPIALQS